MKTWSWIVAAALAASPLYAAAPGTNGRIAFQAPGEEAAVVAIVNADGSGLRPFADGEAPAWGPASFKIAFAKDGQIFVRDLATEAGQKQFREKEMLKNVCAPCVRTVVEILDRGQSA